LELDVAVERRLAESITVKEDSHGRVVERSQRALDFAFARDKVDEDFPEPAAARTTAIRGELVLHGGVGSDGHGVLIGETLDPFDASRPTT